MRWHPGIVFIGLVGATLLAGCSWPPGSATPATPPVEQPAERLENRSPGELSTPRFPPPPPARLPGGAL